MEATSDELGHQMETETMDFNILDVLCGAPPVMLIHAVNGGYLKPDVLTTTPGSHVSEARTTAALTEEIEKAKGHLWYITPYEYSPENKKMQYFIESAASVELTDADTNTDKRRRITYNYSNPAANGVKVGCLKDTGETNEESQLWFVSLALVSVGCCCEGALTFVPVKDPCLIFGNMNNNMAMGECARPVRNLTCDRQGNKGHQFIPKPPHPIHP